MRDPANREEFTLALMQRLREWVADARCGTVV